MYPWTVKISDKALRQLTHFDIAQKKKILAFLERLPNHPSPYTLATHLQAPFKNLWRYRVGDYRIVCDIQRTSCTVLVLAIAHRREVYR